MPDEWIEFTKDPRPICKYGTKCYQKNANHHKTFKHPPQITKKGHVKRKNNRFMPYSREAKPEKAKKNEKQTEVSKDSKETLEDLKVTSEVSKDTSEDLKVTSEDSKVTSEDSKKPSKDLKATSELSKDTSEDSKAISEDSKKTSEDSKEKESTSTEASLRTSLPKVLEDEFLDISINLPENITYYDKNSDQSVLKELFLVQMPQDFYDFFEFLNEDEQGFEKILARVNLELIGPYDLLLGKLPILDDKELYLTHWRFFYDPPEFQAVLKKKDKSQYHIGYYRDSPDDKPEFLASNDSEQGYIITPMAENIFAATYLYLQNEKKSSPFTSMACQKFMERIKKYAESKNYSLEEYDIKKRNSKIVTATFHRTGIVVPYNKKTQLGYRPLVENDANLKKLFKKLEMASTQSEKDKILSELQPVITYASIAMDECDFGTGLEVAIALFCSGLKELEMSALNSFNVAYSLLKREVFSKIIQAHMKYRRKGPNMSLLSSSK